MGIKVNSDDWEATKHIYVPDKGYVKTVKLSDGTVVWAEYAGTWYVNGFATGVSNIVVSRTAADPAVAKSYGTSVSNGTKLYNGDVLKLSAVARSGYTLSSDTKTVTVSTPSPTSSSSRESDYYTGDYDFGGRYMQLNAPTLTRGVTIGKRFNTITMTCKNSNSVTVTAHYGQDTSCSSTVVLTAGSSTTLYSAVSTLKVPADVYVYCYFTDSSGSGYAQSSMSSAVLQYA